MWYLYSWLSKVQKRNFQVAISQHIVRYKIIFSSAIFKYKTKNYNSSDKTDKFRNGLSKTCFKLDKCKLKNGFDFRVPLKQPNAAIFPIPKENRTFVTRDRKKTRKVGGKNEINSTKCAIYPNREFVFLLVDTSNHGDEDGSSFPPRGILNLTLFLPQNLI